MSSQGPTTGLVDSSSCYLHKCQTKEVVQCDQNSTETLRRLCYLVPGLLLFIGREIVWFIRLSVSLLAPGEEPRTWSVRPSLVLQSPALQRAEAPGGTPESTHPRVPGAGWGRISSLGAVPGAPKQYRTPGSRVGEARGARRVPPSAPPLPRSTVARRSRGARNDDDTTSCFGDSRAAPPAPRRSRLSFPGC